MIFVNKITKDILTYECQMIVSFFIFNVSMIKILVSLLVFVVSRNC